MARGDEMRGERGGRVGGGHWALASASTMQSFQGLEV